MKVKVFSPSKLLEREDAGFSSLWTTFGLTIPEGVVGVGGGVDLSSIVLQFFSSEQILTIVCKEVPQFSTIPS